MRLKTLLISIVALLLQLLPAHTKCEGKDLLAAMPATELAELTRRADLHPYPRGNLFRATRGAEVVHLLGTMHLPDPRHEAIVAEVTPLLTASRTLLVEADPEQETRLKAEIIKRPEFMFLTEGPKLNKLLPEAEWQELARRMQENGIPPLMTARFRPWYLAVMLGMPPCATKSVMDGERGLDHQVIAVAQAAGLKVRSLEPYDTLFKLFGDLTLDEELEMIRASLLVAADPEDMMTTTANGYFAGETRLLWELGLQQALETPAATPEAIQERYALMEEVLMNRRNQSWIPVITKALQRGPVFAAFGALHLPGKMGVLALLEAEGFTIEALELPPPAQP